MTSLSFTASTFTTSLTSTQSSFFATDCCYNSATNVVRQHYCRFRRARLPSPQTLSPHARMRNPGGFSSPPRPFNDLSISDLSDKRRAIELLGNFTQRRMHKHNYKNQKSISELRELCGELPRSREQAQQWKKKLQLSLSQQKRKTLPTSTSTSTLPSSSSLNNNHSQSRRDVIISTIVLPRKQETLSRTFILLDVARRRYMKDLGVTPKVKDSLCKYLGIPTYKFPQSERETHAFIRALAYMQRLRVRAERKPPILVINPTVKQQQENLDMEDLQTGVQLLGLYVGNHGRVGQKQLDKLMSIVGAVPPTRNVAKSWKKVIQIVIKRRKRKERVYAKWLVDEQKRKERREKKMKRSLLLTQQDKKEKEQETIDADVTQVAYEPSEQKNNEKNELAVSRPDEQQHEENENENETKKGGIGYLSRLTSALSKLFIIR